MNILKNKSIREFFELDKTMTYHDIIELEILVMILLLYNKYY